MEPKETPNRGSASADSHLSEPDLLRDLVREAVAHLYDEANDTEEELQKTDHDAAQAEEWRERVRRCRELVGFGQTWLTAASDDHAKLREAAGAAIDLALAQYARRNDEVDSTEDAALIDRLNLRHLELAARCKPSILVRVAAGLAGSVENPMGVGLSVESLVDGYLNLEAEEDQ